MTFEISTPTFETLLLIGLGVLGLMAYTWFVVELSWEIVLRRMDRHEQRAEQEISTLEDMMGGSHVVGAPCICYPQGNPGNCPAPGCR